jgi:hypothetical protein
MTSRTPLRPELAGLAWSLWTELGVSGWTRHHQGWLVDPEPLVVFTAWLGDTDARLRDEATDWCVRYGFWLSAARLVNLVSGASAETSSRYGELAATVAAHSVLRWRGASNPRAFKPTGRSRVESLIRPSMLSLRLRSVLGVGARAEIIRILLAAPRVPQIASDLVCDAGFKKRNIADALDSLRLGGVLEGERTRNQIRYRLRDPAAWRRLMGELPTVWPRWTRILPALASVVDGAERSASLPLRVRNVELNKLVRAIAPDVAAAHLPAPPTMEPAGSVADRFEDWARRIVEDLSAGRVGVLAAQAP